MHMAMDILYEDNHILAVDKPPGIETQGELEAGAKEYIKSKFNKPGEVFLHAVHRLDQRASGICLFARTSKALSRLSKSLRENKWERTYLARVETAPEGPEGVLVDYLRHGEGRAEPDPQGKRCELSYQVIGPNLLRIKLKTGRYHQIRAQLGARGMPITGDVKYGAKRVPGPGIALRHVRLAFPHPVKDETVVVTAAEFE